MALRGSQRVSLVGIVAGHGIGSGCGRVGGCLGSWVALGGSVWVGGSLGLWVWLWLSGWLWWGLVVVWSGVSGCGLVVWFWVGSGQGCTGWLKSTSCTRRDFSMHIVHLKSWHKERPTRESES